MWLLGRVYRWACALYSACSSALVSLSGLNPGSARDASGQAVFVYGRAPNYASLGSCEIYSVALRGTVMGLQCMTRRMPKQLRSAS